MEQNTNIFKYAFQNKLRFPFKGQIQTEDLFDLSLENLDAIYKALSKQVKSDTEESLLSVRTKDDDDLKIKIMIIKEIFSDKQAEINARLLAAETKAKNQKIMSIIARKEEADLENKSIDELKAMLG